MLWGLVGVQKEAVLAADRVLVTVEELVDELEPRPSAIVLPAWTVSAISVVPGGAHPSYAAGYSTRDNDFYLAWDEISRDRDRFGPGSTRRCAVAEPEAKPDEVMTINAARGLRDGEVCLVGVGPPNAAVNLARRLHAPNCVLVYESGAIGSKPVRLPLSIGDDDLAETADAIVSVPGDVQLLDRRAGGSTSAFSAPPRSTAAGRSTPR